MSAAIILSTRWGGFWQEHRLSVGLLSWSLLTTCTFRAAECPEVYTRDVFSQSLVLG